LAISSASLAAAAELRFWKENISVRIHAVDTITVTGTYYFKSSTGEALSSGLFYPFPLDSIHDFPVRYSVRSGASGKAIVSRKSGTGLYFSVDILPNAVCSVLVSYTQHVRQPSARYILTTTAAWRQPLGPSNYSVALPSAWTLSYLSYETDSVTSRGGLTTYHFFRDNFMPERDLGFAWEVGKARK
jgi:hypothetical protein